MKTSALAALLGTLLLAGGCATSTVTWSKVGATQEQGNKDVEACADEANLMVRRSEGMLETGALLGTGFKNANFEECMTKRGYRKN